MEKIFKTEKDFSNYLRTQNLFIDNASRVVDNAVDYYDVVDEEGKFVFRVAYVCTNNYEGILSYISM